MIKESKIKRKFDSIDWKRDYDAVIEFYESAKTYFNNHSNFKNREDIEELIIIQLYYVFALDEKHHYTKASKILPSIKYWLGELSNSESYSNLTERYLFASGVIHRRLKETKKSQTYFIRLIEIDPDNDLYKEWYKLNHERLLYEKFRVFGYLGALLLILVTFCGDPLGFQLRFKRFILLIGVIMMLSGFYWSEIRKFIKK